MSLGSGRRQRWCSETAVSELQPSLPLGSSMYGLVLFSDFLLTKFLTSQEPKVDLKTGCRGSKVNLHSWAELHFEPSKAQSGLLSP